MWVCRFRVISCRDAASVLSKCAGWFSVCSVCSVFKKIGAPPLIYSLADFADDADFGWRDDY